MDTISCKHGNLARSCEICVLTDELTRFQGKLDQEKIAKVFIMRRQVAMERAVRTHP